jgi:hypothetical protein
MFVLEIFDYVFSVYYVPALVLSLLFLLSVIVFHFYDWLRGGSDEG